MRCKQCRSLDIRLIHEELIPRRGKTPQQKLKRYECYKCKTRYERHE